VRMRSSCRSKQGGHTCHVCVCVRDQAKRTEHGRESNREKESERAREREHALAIRYPVDGVYSWWAVHIVVCTHLFGGGGRDKQGE